MSEQSRRAWIDIGIRLAKDPWDDAQCPDCNNGQLACIAVAAGDYEDLHVFCHVCGTRNVISRRGASPHLLGAQPLFVIADTFMLSRLGLLLAPGVDQSVQVRPGDAIVITRPDASRLFARVTGIATPSPNLPQHMPISIGSRFRKQDVPPGSKVWLRGSEAS